MLENVSVLLFHVSIFCWRTKVHFCFSFALSEVSVLENLNSLVVFLGHVSVGLQKKIIFKTEESDAAVSLSHDCFLCLHRMHFPLLNLFKLLLCTQCLLVLPASITFLDWGSFHKTLWSPCLVFICPCVWSPIWLSMKFLPLLNTVSRLFTVENEKLSKIHYVLLIYRLWCLSLAFLLLQSSLPFIFYLFFLAGGYHLFTFHACNKSFPQTSYLFLPPLSCLCMWSAPIFHLF